MCHEYHARDWDHEPVEESNDEDADDEGTPAFLNEESGDVELLTDGGE